MYPYYRYKFVLLMELKLCTLTGSEVRVDIKANTEVLLRSSKFSSGDFHGWSLRGSAVSWL